MSVTLFPRSIEAHHVDQDVRLTTHGLVSGDLIVVLVRQVCVAGLEKENVGWCECAILLYGRSQRFVQLDGFRALRHLLCQVVVSGVDSGFVCARVWSFPDGLSVHNGDDALGMKLGLVQSI
jgi:hypothetical protein